MDNKKRIKLFALLLCALVVVGGALQLILSASAKDVVAAPPEQEAQILELVNRARSAAGSAPLAWDERAAKVAVEKVSDMIKLKYFAHVSPKTGDLDKQFEKWGKLKLGGNIMGLGENLAQAQGYDDKELTAEFWHNGSMNSPEHRKNVLNPLYTHIGIAIKKGPDGKVFMAQAFITPMGETTQQKAPAAKERNTASPSEAEIPQLPASPEDVGSDE